MNRPLRVDLLSQFSGALLTFSSKPCDAFKESPNWSWFIGLKSLALDHLFDIEFVEWRVLSFSQKWVCCYKTFWSSKILLV